MQYDLGVRTDCAARCYRQRCDGSATWTPAALPEPSLDRCPRQLTSWIRFVPLVGGRRLRHWPAPQIAFTQAVDCIRRFEKIKAGEAGEAGAGRSGARCRPEVPRASIPIDPDQPEASWPRAARSLQHIGLSLVPHPCTNTCDPAFLPADRLFYMLTRSLPHGAAARRMLRRKCRLPTATPYSQHPGTMRLACTPGADAGKHTNGAAFTAHMHACAACA
eukprot:351768-Chlamydomonas_euryale.AAC.4